MDRGLIYKSHNWHFPIGHDEDTLPTIDASAASDKSAGMRERFVDLENVTDDTRENATTVTVTSKFAVLVFRHRLEKRYS
jgi:hypothetical protein